MHLRKPVLCLLSALGSLWCLHFIKTKSLYLLFSPNKISAEEFLLEFGFLFFNYSFMFSRNVLKVIEKCFGYLHVVRTRMAEEMEWIIHGGSVALPVLLLSAGRCQHLSGCWDSGRASYHSRASASIISTFFYLCVYFFFVHWTFICFGYLNMR